MNIPASSRKRALLASAAAVHLLTAGAVAARDAKSEAKTLYQAVLMQEAHSRPLCEARPDRVHVTHPHGSECIAYFATTRPTPEAPTVLYFEGDVPREEFDTPGFEAKYLAESRTSLQRLAERYSVRFVFVARPGLFGSSGNHGLRRRPAEMASMNAAVTAIKARLGVLEVALAGQSGGATVAAALLTLGRRDITCAVLGSGGFETVEGVRSWMAQTGKPMPSSEALRRVLYEPFAHMAKVAPAPARRVLVLGDPTDKRTPYYHQARFARELGDRGHHAVAVEVAGRGDLNHGVAHLALPAAAQCARGDRDESIIRLARSVPRPQRAKPTPIPGAAATSSMAR